MQLTRYDDPMLHKVSRACPKGKRKLIEQMLHDTYYKRPFGSCAGMAAPQIGYPYNSFVARGEVFTNVQGVKGVGETYVTSEGCFSTPGFHAVKRYHEIVVTAEDGTLTKYLGHMAQVIQHEYDHIKGILISDKER